MSIRNLILGVNSVTVAYLIHYDSLLQNATDFTTNCDSNLLQNASGFLLQSAIVLLQMRQLLKIVTILFQNATFITLIATVQSCRNKGEVEFLNEVKVFIVFADNIVLFNY